LIGLQDEFYNQQMMQEHLFEPILNILYESMPRDNLLNSACLEFFEYIKSQNIKVLVNHLVETYREKIKDIVYVDIFSSLILKYDQMQGYNANLDASFLDTEEDTPGRTQIEGGRRWQGVKDLDATEEEYFNTSDDEDENPSKSPSNRTPMNGASPLTKPLVDYTSDEDNESMETDVTASFSGIPPTLASSKVNSAITPLLAAKPPPERLSEKRRREEDDEDELGKLSHQNPKRRNSSSSVSSAGSNASNTVRRKKSFTSGKDSGGGGPKKIAISLAPAPKKAVESNGDSHSDS
jgi:protein phosphatase-4 regulatory subunit 3